MVKNGLDNLDSAEMPRLLACMHAGEREKGGGSGGGWV